MENVISRPHGGLSHGQPDGGGVARTARNVANALIGEMGRPRAIWSTPKVKEKSPTVRRPG